MDLVSGQAKAAKEGKAAAAEPEAEPEAVPEPEVVVGRPAVVSVRLSSSVYFPSSSSGADGSGGSGGSAGGGETKRRDRASETRSPLPSLPASLPRLALSSLLRDLNLHSALALVADAALQVSSVN